LAIAAADRMVRYVVEDEGPGVPESEIERIFDIYVTEAGGESRGAGLGLPLSRRLARLLGGELRAGPRPGAGSCSSCQPPREYREEHFTKSYGAVQT
jgi:signal transduction histidine kinase